MCCPQNISKPQCISIKLLFIFKSRSRSYCLVNFEKLYPQGEHSAICSTFIKLPFVFKTFVLSIFKWPLKTGFTVHAHIKVLSPVAQKFRPVFIFLVHNTEKLLVILGLSYSQHTLPDRHTNTDQHNMP